MEKMAALPKRKIKIALPSSKQQTNYTCGAACLRSISKYYKKDLKDESSFSSLCNAGEKKGCRPDDLVTAAKSLGFDVKMKQNMTIEELIRYIDEKTPVIVAIQAWSNSEDTKKEYKKLKCGHYVVAIGHDDKKIYFEDPSVQGARPYLPKEEFLERWIDREAYKKEHAIKRRLGIIIKPKDDTKPNKSEITKTRKLL